MSASAMLDGILDNLNSSSVLGASGASTDYYVLETTSACCAVVSWQSIDINPITFGEPMGDGTLHTMLIEGFVRDNNDPVQLMKDSAGLADLLTATLKSDNTLQGTIDSTMKITARKNLHELASAGGLTWSPIYIEIEGFEFS